VTSLRSTLPVLSFRMANPMSNLAYLLEATRNGKTKHHLCSTEKNALEWAALHLRVWIYGSDTYNKSLRKQVKALLSKGEDADAIRAWNNFYCDRLFGSTKSKSSRMTAITNLSKPPMIATSWSQSTTTAVRIQPLWQPRRCSRFVGRLLALDGHKSDRATRKEVNLLLDAGKTARGDGRVESAEPTRSSSRSDSGNCSEEFGHRQRWTNEE